MHFRQANPACNSSAHDTSPPFSGGICKMVSGNRASIGHNQRRSAATRRTTETATSRNAETQADTWCRAPDVSFLPSPCLGPRSARYLTSRCPKPVPGAKRQLIPDKPVPGTRRCPQFANRSERREATHRYQALRRSLFRQCRPDGRHCP